MTHHNLLRRSLSVLVILLVATSFAAAQEEEASDSANSAPATARERKNDDRPRRSDGFGFRNRTGQESRRSFGQGSRDRDERDRDEDDLDDGDVDDDRYQDGDAGDRSSESVDTGFVILDGVYVNAPYRFHTDNGITYVNDLPITQSADLVANVERREGAQRFGMGSRYAPRPIWVSVDELTDGGVLWIEDGRRTFLHHTSNGFAFLKYVVGESGDLDDFSVSNVPPHVREWLASYSAPPQFVDRARVQVDRMETIWNAESSAKEAQSLLEKIHYPMTLFGLLVAATAAGHLFTSWPSLVTQTQDPEVEARRARIVWRSMAFVLVLSGLDLVWTVLASRAGTMQELNPLAGRFIADPAMLSYFKVLATGLGIGLLIWLRRHHSAQTASLWLCLVCTLLTCRWLTYTSLFAS